MSLFCFNKVNVILTVIVILYYIGNCTICILQSCAYQIYYTLFEKLTLHTLSAIAIT